MKIDRENFEEWLAHPITEALLKCCDVWIDEAKEAWVKASWDGGEANPTQLARMQERARTLAQVKDVRAETIEETLT